MLAIAGESGKIFSMCFILTHKKKKIVYLYFLNMTRGGLGRERERVAARI